jgi:hypothetical protein
MHIRTRTFPMRIWVGSDFDEPICTAMHDRNDRIKPWEEQAPDHTYCCVCHTFFVVYHGSKLAPACCCDSRPQRIAPVSICIASQPRSRAVMWVQWFLYAMRRNVCTTATCTPCSCSIEIARGREAPTQKCSWIATQSRINGAWRQIARNPFVSLCVSPQ